MRPQTYGGPEERALRYRRDILALRGYGLSYRAIAAALRHYRRSDMTAEQVRYWLVKWGAPTNPRKARPRVAA